MVAQNQKRIDVLLLGIQPLIGLIAPFSIYMFGGIRTVVLLLLFVCFYFNKNKAEINNSRIIAIFVGVPLFVYTISLITTLTFPSIGLIWGLLYGAIFLKYSREEQLAAFNIFVKALSWLLFISLIEYVIIQILGGGIIIGNVERIQTTSDTEQHFDHYIFNLIKEGILPRFQSLTSEPGDIGTICGLLIFIIGEKKKYKFPLIIFIISGLLSFSLAFYALILIFIPYYFLKTKRISSLIIFFLIALSFYSLFGDIFDDRILKRSETVEGLNSRSNDDFDKIYVGWLNRFDVSILFGNGEGATNEMNIGKGVVGYKRELYDFGFVGVFLLLLSYFVVYFKYNKCSKHTAFFMVIFMISWFQRSYLFFTPYLILIFNIYNVMNYNQKALPTKNHLVHQELSLVNI